MTDAAPLRLRDAGAGTVVAHRVDQALGFRSRFLGLMGRGSLADGEGLYLPESSIHMMFMRFPIDALFVAEPDDQGRRRVVDVRHDLPPWRGLVLPVKGASGVVELPAGTLRRAGIGPGDLVRLESDEEVGAAA